MVSKVEQRIRNIENGLVEFTAPMDMFQPDSIKAKNRKTLSERMAHYKVPGVSIAVINDNEIDWAKGYGVIKAGSDTPVTTETLFEAASSTKSLTAAIALRLVEQGRLDLDEDVNRQLKSWKIPENSFTQQHKVTLRLLLTHQSGLNRPDGGFDWENESVPSLVHVLKGETPAKNEGAVVEYVPGTKWQYSNIGYVVIQLLLKDVVGKPFTRIAQENVFGPIGMKSSTLAYPLNAELRKREAMPHDSEGKACEPSMLPTAVAHAGLMTTPSEFAQFAIELMRAYQGQSDRILSQEMARNLFHRELDLDPNMFGLPLGDGLGVVLRGKGRDFSFLHPGGNYPGACCWLEGLPDSGKGAVIMTNGVKGDLLSMEIISALIVEYNWPNAE